eukprot:scaffold2514_cov373-Prasinococcus_capsulatus_cf.AAC.6
MAWVLRPRAPFARRHLPGGDAILVIASSRAAAMVPCGGGGGGGGRYYVGRPRSCPTAPQRAGGKVLGAPRGAAAARRMAASGAGLYCSTSNTTFESEEALREHYKSDWHRYNLKRKVAGLPPVTREWFESRRAALQAATAAPSQEASTWICQLTGKKFKNEATYKAFTESKKYKDALRRAGGVALPPLVRSRHTKTPEEIEDKRQRQREKAELEKQARAESAGMPLADEEHEDEDEDSEWETDEEADPDVVRDELMREQEDDHDAMAVEWDPRRCLFSNHVRFRP